MNRHLAATLICLCLTGATYASDGAVQAPSAPPAATAPTTAASTPSAPASRPPASLISTATAAEASPMVRRAATHNDGSPRYVQALAAMPDAPPAAAQGTDADRQGRHSNTLWIVGLVLIAGIALRRWGFERA